MGFMADKVSPGKVSLPVLLFSPRQYSASATYSFVSLPLCNHCNYQRLQTTRFKERPNLSPWLHQSRILHKYARIGSLVMSQISFVYSCSFACHINMPHSAACQQVTHIVCQIKYECSVQVSVHPRYALYTYCTGISSLPHFCVEALDL
jgi:hypothetical protein